MRAAPAVEAALGQGRVERVLITGLHAAAGAAFAVWSAAHAEPSASPLAASLLLTGLPWLAGLVGAMAFGALGCWLARRALPGGPARLCWDGAIWQLQRHADGLPHAERRVPLQRLVVSLDLGAWMLLQLVPADGSPRRWQAVGAHGVGSAWHDLRVALQAHAGDPRSADAGAADAGAAKGTTHGPGARQ